MRLGFLTLAMLLLCSCTTIMPATQDYGRRSWGTSWHDQLVESRGMQALRDASPELKTAHVSITCFNGIALITGQVPSDAARKLAGDTVAKVAHVRTVHNELQIAGPTSMVARTNDSWLTAKVKTELLASDKVSGNRIKVVTEDGVVYLMGLVSHRAAKAAVDVARQVYGVQKIVTAFEYID